MLADVGPVVVLGDAAVLASGQTQLQVNLTLDVAAGCATLQWVPLVHSCGWDVLKQPHKLSFIHKSETKEFNGDTANLYTEFESKEFKVIQLTFIQNLKQTN